ATVLPLHSWSLVAFLGAAGFIDDTHGTRAAMLACHQLLHALQHERLIPVQQRQELLQRPRRHTLRQSHRFDALAWQIRKLATHIHGQVRPRARILKTIVKLTQVAAQRWPQLADFLGVHAGSSQVLDTPTAWDIPANKTRPSLAL